MGPVSTESDVRYHIRYGGYGGIGYYLVSDSYIALFSRFNTCGAWEGHYSWTSFEKTSPRCSPTRSDADTQGQNTAIFGLGICWAFQLMPRIRNWEDLHLCSDRRRVPLCPHRFPIYCAGRFASIPPCCPICCAWHCRSRRVMSHRRRSSTASQPTAARTSFTSTFPGARVEWPAPPFSYCATSPARIADNTIQAATNKSGRLPDCAVGVLVAMARLPKMRATNSESLSNTIALVANLLTFHTLVTITSALWQLLQGGHTADTEALAKLSPYQTEHINRFGNYSLNPNRTPEPLEQHLGITLA